MTKATVAVGLLLLAAMVPVAAQDGRDGLRQACKDDYQRLCANVAPGGGRIRKCMLDNSEKLSPGCKTALNGQQRSN